MLRDAAASGQMLMTRCGLCGRSANYWATDLVKVLGPLHEVHVPPFKCSRCGTRDYVDVKVTVPAASQLNTLTVRRPIRQITKWIWRNEGA